MDYHVTLKELHDQPAAVVHGEVGVEEIGPFVNEAFGKVMASLASAGFSPAGPPFARYDMHDSRFAVDAGFPCMHRHVDGGEVRMTHLPAGLAATTLHVGSYSDVSSAYTALQQWMRDNDYEPAGAPWETYLDGPDAEKPRTLITWPCEKAS